MPTQDSQMPLAGKIGLSLVFLILLALGFMFATDALSALTGPLTGYSWEPVPATVVASNAIGRKLESGQSRFRATIRFQYVWKGLPVVSEEGFDYPDDSGALQAVGRYPVGARITCYVNPESPGQAILHRPSWLPPLAGVLIPLALVLFGGGGVAFVLFRRRRRPRLDSAVESISAADATLGFLRRRGKPASEPLKAPAGESARQFGGPLVLTPTSSRVGSLVGTAVFCLLWNGIVSAFVFAGALGEAGCIMIPFLVVGALVILAVVYQFLTLFNPQPTVTLSAAPIRLGDVVTVSWEIAGRVTRLQRLRIFVEGREEARYRRGTTTYTDKNIFASLDIFTTDATDTMGSGTARLAIPHDAMHTFHATNNKVLWNLRVEGEIRRWPDVSEEFEIEILPCRPGSLRGRRRPDELAAD